MLLFKVPYNVPEDYLRVITCLGSSFRFFERDAFTSPRYGGEGRPGRDLNSAWYCVAKWNVLVGSSSISILRLASLFPENLNPFEVSCGMYLGLTSNRCLCLSQAFDF